MDFNQRYIVRPMGRSVDDDNAPKCLFCDLQSATRFLVLAKRFSAEISSLPHRRSHVISPNRLPRDRRRISHERELR
jgi:hypothetical protein